MIQPRPEHAGLLRDRIRALEAELAAVRALAWDAGLRLAQTRAVIGGEPVWRLFHEDQP